MTEQKQPCSADANTANTNNTATTVKYKTIEEGSAIMVYPEDQKRAVFYNPVQVQNRDLSVLMIQLYAERKRIRQLVNAKKIELRKAKLSSDEVKEQLKKYEQELVEKFDGKKNGNDDDTIMKEVGNDDKNGLHILDALAASGLRSIRYWKEISDISHITINDLDIAAVERAHANLEKNDLVESETKDRSSRGIRIRHGDAMHELYISRRDPTVSPIPAGQDVLSEQYDVIDLDPYGSAAPFLDGAVQAVRDGGMLNVTCTDMAALGGSHPETCYGRYNGSLPIQRAPYLQEAAVRILLQSIAVTAAKYGRTIKPILSVGMNFYVRVFVEVYNDRAGVEALSLKIGNIYQSTQCASYYTKPQGKLADNGRYVYQSSRVTPERCQETNAPFKVGGPIWLGSMHDTTVVKLALRRLKNVATTKKEIDATAKNNNKMILATKDRIIGLLTSVSEELSDVPLYYTLPNLSHILSCPTPPMMKFKSALINAGYRVSGYHKEPNAVKTDAPPSVVWDIMRVWCQTHKSKQLSKKKQKRLQRKKEKQRLKTEQQQGSSNNKDASNDSKETDKPKQPSASEKILAIQPSIDFDFTVTNVSNVIKSDNITRFPMNPEKGWGPKARAVGNNNNKKRKHDEEGDDDDEKETQKSKTN